ncbi:hypothetical protein [Arenicella sp. 4NH20-0111]|uniref:hypothetical protein n=1 Tax=Arenicella sp. 4NH20-0111 TaxID=3127648 RepID=UPI00333F79C2
MLFNYSSVFPSRCLRILSAIVFTSTVVIGTSVGAQETSGSAASAAPVNNGNYLNEDGYRILGEGESEFDNYSDSFVRDWRNADPDYDDTEFGDLMYNEASIPTKLEVLRLLSKDTPSMLVFLQAVAMGVDIEDVLKASVSYEPDKAQDLAASAVSIIPVLSDKASYLYSGYELEDLEREDDESYKVQDVIDRFFEQREVLRPYPDWFEGQYHFLASAQELEQLQNPEKEVKWYRTKSTVDIDQRPVFVSLYEGNQAVLIDGEDRITDALAKDPEALLPVVVIFNRVNERSIDQLGYSKTLRGVQQAYSEERLMLTPTPEWQLGEYHMYADVSEFYDIFDIPEEDDFEPEAWIKLLEEAEDYSVMNTSFIVVILSGGSGEDESEEQTALAKRKVVDSHVQFAVWDDPRTEAEFQYVAPRDNDSLSMENILGEGMIFNRPDLLAALKTLGVTKVPVSFYYIDSDRTKPFIKGARGLINSVTGTLLNPAPPSSSGGITPCASPPCIDQ